MKEGGETEFVPAVVKLRDGRYVTLRTVLPQDRDEIHAAIKRLSPDSRYARFMSPLHELSPAMLDRAVNPERGNELQLVAIYKDGTQETIVGGARYSAGAGSKDCEFAVAIVDDWHGLGLARRLMEILMHTARARGFERMEGYILATNARMLELSRRLGFVDIPSSEGPTVRLVRCNLHSMT